MAYYDALVAKWATLTGTTQSKLAQINALTVAGAVPQKALLTPSQILNACSFAELATLTQLQISQLSLLLQGSSIDASVGTNVRAGVSAVLAGKTASLAGLAALVAPYDTPALPWITTPVAAGGGGLTGPVSMNDLAAAGGLS